ncbi:MAG: alpha/beta hydrolase [Deltaproteobacteria bacterium]|nr:alpha/beta hydrolase [Deltaproteobacteria bacterium]
MKQKTIVMIHGMWGGGWYWENYRKYFEAKGYQCIVPTLRYHDVNPKETPPAGLGTTSILDYVSDLEKLIKKGGGKPILMGHSMGGLIAQILGSRDLAEALVLLTPASPSGIIALKPSVIKSFRSVFSQWAFWKRPIRQTFAEAVYAMLHLLPSQQQIQTYERFVYESGQAGFEMGFWLFDSKRATQVNEKKVTCPILVIAGAEDRITPPAVVKKIHKKYGDISTYRELSGHAHWVVGEAGWEDITELIQEWLSRNVKNG